MSKIIDRKYKQIYADIFKNLYDIKTQGFYDEAALPSYTHSNRFMSWLFWKRIETALRLAGDLRNQSLLDFGCGGCVTFRYLSECGCDFIGCDCGFYEMARQICKALNVGAEIYRDLFQITKTKFDCIMALDVLEHIEDVDLYVEKLIDMAHDKTKIIISGPTENLLYKAGRWLAGFSGDYHLRNIYDIEHNFKNKGLKRRILKRLFPPFTLFRISMWSKSSADNEKVNLAVKKVHNRYE